MSGSTHTSHDVNVIHNISKQTRDDARTMKMWVMVVAVVEPANDILVTIGRKTGFLDASTTTRVGPWLGIHDSKVLNVHFFIKHCLCPVASLDRAYVGANGNHALPGHEEANHPTNEGWDVLLWNRDVVLRAGDDTPRHIGYDGIHVAVVCGPHRLVFRFKQLVQFPNVYVASGVTVAC